MSGSHRDVVTTRDCLGCTVCNLTGHSTQSWLFKVLSKCHTVRKIGHGLKSKIFLIFLKFSPEESEFAGTVPNRFEKYLSLYICDAHRCKPLQCLTYSHLILSSISIFQSVTSRWHSDIWRYKRFRYVAVLFQSFLPLLFSFSGWYIVFSLIWPNLMC